jgi:hypothetical protein
MKLLIFIMKKTICFFSFQSKKSQKRVILICTVSDQNRRATPNNQSKNPVADATSLFIIY